MYMTNKDIKKVKKYQNSTGLSRAWYNIVIALTMGNVEAALEQYELEQREEESPMHRCNYAPRLGGDEE